MQGVISQVDGYVPASDVEQVTVGRWGAMPSATKTTLPEVYCDAVSPSFPHSRLFKWPFFWEQVDTRLRVKS